MRTVRKTFCYSLGLPEAAVASNVAYEDVRGICDTHVVRVGLGGARSRPA